MKISRVLSIAGLVMFGIVCVLCIIWFDWKLIIILFLANWSSNLATGADVHRSGGD